MIASKGGHVVNIASLAGHAGTNKLVGCFTIIITIIIKLIYNHFCAKVDYCSSKFAAVGLDEAFRVELAVQVNAHLPFKLDIFNQHYAIMAFITFFVKSFKHRVTATTSRRLLCVLITSRRACFLEFM